jgi:hypothetical protein
MFSSKPLSWQKNTVEMYGSQPIHSPVAVRKKLSAKESVLQDRNITIVILQFLDQNWELMRYTRVCGIWLRAIKNSPFGSKTFMNDVKVLCKRLEYGLSSTSDGKNHDYPFAILFNQDYRFTSLIFRTEKIPLLENCSGEKFLLPMYIRYRFWPEHLDDAFYLDTSDFYAKWAKFQNHPRCPEKAQKIVNCLNRLARQARERANLLKIKNWLYVMNNGLANQPVIIEQYF